MPLLQFGDYRFSLDFLGKSEYNLKMFDDLENRRFGRLVAKERVGGKKWLCECDCGNQKMINPSNLKRGLTKSCGCLNRELSSVRNAALKITHGRSHTSVHRAWQGMRQRCDNPRDKSYANYGARGIVVCERWRSFENFLADIGEKPGAGYSLDRIDVNGNYEPSNCRWATIVEQNRNKRNNLVVEVNGRRGCLAEFIPQGSCSPEYQRAQNRIKRGLSI